MSQRVIPWQRSSFSGAGGENCIELARHEGQFCIRESDAPGEILTVTRDGLGALIQITKTQSLAPAPAP